MEDRTRMAGGVFSVPGTPVPIIVPQAPPPSLPDQPKPRRRSPGTKRDTLEDKDFYKSFPESYDRGEDR